MTQAPLEIRVMELESALSIERAHRAAAEQVALAHEQRAKTAEMALRMLEAAPKEQRPAHWWKRR